MFEKHTYSLVLSLILRFLPFFFFHFPLIFYLLFLHGLKSDRGVSPTNRDVGLTSLPVHPWLYPLVGPSVGRSVRRSVRRPVGPLRLCKNRVSRLFFATLISYTETNDQPTCFESLFTRLFVHLSLHTYVTWSIHAETQHGRIVARSGLLESWRTSQSGQLDASSAWFVHRRNGHMDGRTDGWTNRQTDWPSYRDAMTHLKMSWENEGTILSLCFLVADTRLYTLPCRSVGPSVPWLFWIPSGFCTTAPAQPSATGLPYIRPCLVITPPPKIKK